MQMLENHRKSVNTIAKPINLWKNDEEHTPAKKIGCIIDGPDLDDS